MQVRFEAGGTEAERELRSLYRWLVGDRALRGEAAVEEVRHRDPAHMGSELEAVLAVVSTAAAVSQLPFSYSAWRQGRRPGGRIEITVKAADEAEARAMLRRLEERPSADPEEPPATGPEGSAP